MIDRILQKLQIKLFCLDDKIKFTCLLGDLGNKIQDIRTWRNKH
jgi:hypothetical protein